MSADDVFSSRATSEAINSASQTSVSPTKASPRISQICLLCHVLIVEALAQAGGVLALKSESINPDTHVMFFLSINNVKFRKTVTPGDQLRLEVVPLRKGKVWKMRGEAFVGETLVCEAEFMASLVARDENTSSADKT